MKALVPTRPPSGGERAAERQPRQNTSTLQENVVPVQNGDLDAVLVSVSNIVNLHDWRDASLMSAAHHQLADAIWQKQLGDRAGTVELVRDILRVYSGDLGLAE